MKQYTSPDQTAKLIELGFEKPNSIASVDPIYGMGGISVAKAYTIGELIEMLPKHIEIESQWCRLDIYPTKNKWHINYDNIVFNSLAKAYETELIDALYEMIIKLKEEGVI